MDTHIISSSHGQIKTDKDGVVIERMINTSDADQTGHLSAIYRFDFAEYQMSYGKQVPAYVDILLLGYWYGADSKYEPAVEDFRQEMKKARGQ